VTLTVGIAGAGIGGLTLAHALRRRGIDCVVLDRDAGPSDTAGYRLHLTAEAFRALTGIVPDGSVRALRDCGSGTFDRFAVLDHRGHTRLRIPMSHPGEVLMIGRRPLRAILARGLGNTVRWGTPVRGFTVSDDGVTIDGHTRVDVLVAADGTGSRVAARWVGRPTARPAGVVGIAGRAVLPRRIPADLRHGPAFAVGPGGVGGFFSLHADQGTDAAAEPPYVVWSVAAPVDRFPADPRTLSPAALIAAAHRLIRGWSPGFHALVDGSDPDAVAAFPFHFPAALRPWPAGPVTLLGDAIHPMPPTAGAGASTAILDAVHLAGDLADRPAGAALAAYQDRLLRYAPAAVAEARPPLFWQRAMANPLVRLLGTEVVLPAADAGFRLHRALTG
jgi:salicylate hydroxylase